MRPGLTIILALSAAVALVAGLYLRDDGAAAVTKAPTIDTAKPSSSGPETSLKAVSSLSELQRQTDGKQSAASVEQLAREIYDQSAVKKVRDFGADLRAFIGEAELLPAQDHEPKARELLAQVDELAATGYVTGPEALALRLSLLKYALPPDDFRVAANSLVNDARERAERAEQEWATRDDPQLEQYHAEERRIVEQSASMTEFPDGMTRQAYLREKLRLLRSEIFTE